MRLVIGLFKLMRPKQWLKNVILFAGVVFGELFTIPSALLTALAAFGIFCMLSGAVYALNDSVDAEKDRLHPEKRRRPIATGDVPRPLGYVWSIALAGVGLYLAWTINLNFAVVGAVYLTLNLAYSFWAKGVVILDVFLIAVGFVLRAIAGVEALVALPYAPPDFAPSSWFLLVTLFLALFLGLEKRRAEINSLKDGAAGHRKTLDHYSPRLLDQMSAVVTTATVISYSLYTMWPDTVARFGTNALVYTVPIVLFGIFRYLYDVDKRNLGGNPSTILFKDAFLLVTVVVWVAAVVLILYFKPQV